MKHGRRIVILKLILGFVALFSLALLIWSQFQYVHFGISLTYEVEAFGNEIANNPQLKFREAELNYIMDSFLLVGAYSLFVLLCSVSVISIRWKDRVPNAIPTGNTTK